ncbi:MAG: hypothetical protein K0R00_3243 [Herbinix sp.]|nr:hypothetical protein [Herbinix sp.]
MSQQSILRAREGAIEDTLPQKLNQMKQKRRITIISMLGLIMLCMTGMIGCNLFPATENTVSGAHISQEEKDKALISKENWNNNRIDYVPTILPTPTPMSTPTHKVATVSCTNKIFPSSVKKGESFHIGGLISTNIGTINNVTGCFISKDGTVVTKTSDHPKSSTYEIKQSIVDEQLAFGNLKLGEYICVIKVKGSNFDETEIMRFNFTISTKTVIGATLKTKVTPTTVPKVTPTTVPTIAPTAIPTTVPIATPTITSTKSPESTKAFVKILTEEEREIADKVVNAAYPKNCNIVVNYKKSNDSGYEYYKIISKYDEKSVATMQEYEDDASEIEAVDFYITTIGETIKKFVYIDGCGWRRETVNKAYLMPARNKTAVSINLEDYLDNTTGGQWSVEITSSEYIVKCTGIKNETNSNIRKDITIITDRNYEIKSVNIKNKDINGIFRDENGYSIDITIEVLDKNKTKISVPEEVISDKFDFEQYVVDIVKKNHSEDITINRDTTGNVTSFTYYNSEKKRKVIITFDEAVNMYGLDKYK